MQQPSIAKTRIQAIDFQEDTNRLDRERQAKIAEMEKELARLKKLDRKRKRNEETEKEVGSEEENNFLVGDIRKDTLREGERAKKPPRIASGVEKEKEREITREEKKALDFARKQWTIKGFEGIATNLWMEFINHIDRGEVIDSPNRRKRKIEKIDAKQQAFKWMSKQRRTPMMMTAGAQVAFERHKDERIASDARREARWASNNTGFKPFIYTHRTKKRRRNLYSYRDNEGGNTGTPHTNQETKTGVDVETKECLYTPIYGYPKGDVEVSIPLGEATQPKPKEPTTYRSDTRVNPNQKNPKGNRIGGIPVHPNIRNSNSIYMVNKHVRPEDNKEGEREGRVIPKGYPYLSCQKGHMVNFLY